MKCTDAGLTLTPDLDRVVKLREELQGINPLEDLLWRMGQNRQTAIYLAAHVQMRRENGHTLGNLIDQSKVVTLEYTALCKEYRAFEEHGKEALENMSPAERSRLVAQAARTWPLDHHRELLDALAVSYNQRTNPHYVRQAPELPGGNGTPVE